MSEMRLLYSNENVIYVKNWLRKTNWKTLDLWLILFILVNQILNIFWIQILVESKNDFSENNLW